MTKYDYIPNEFARTWVAANHEARRGIFTPLVYIDINEGNRFDADVFAQIMYWHEPNKETGQTRLTHRKDDNLWLAKNHADWFAETRIRMATVRKCLTRLMQRKLIFCEQHGDKGKTTPWIRVNWDEFERRINLWMKNNIASISEKSYEKAMIIFKPTPVTVGQGVCPEITGGVLQDNIPLLPDSSSNTETIPETTPETTNKEIVVPMPLALPAPVAIAPTAHDDTSNILPIEKSQNGVGKKPAVHTPPKSKPAPAKSSAPKEPPPVAVGSPLSADTGRTRIHARWKDMRIGRLSGDKWKAEIAQINADIDQLGAPAVEKAIDAANEKSNQSGEAIFSWNFVRCFYPSPAELAKRKQIGNWLDYADNTPPEERKASGE